MKGKIGKFRILLVDDQMATVEQLTPIVKSGVSELRLAITSSEESALAQLTSLRPHVLILDLNLSKGSALNVLTAAKSLANPPVIVVLMHASGAELRKRAHEVGADHFLKGVGDEGMLSNIIRSVAERSGGLAADSDRSAIRESEDDFASEDSLGAEDRERRRRGDSSKTIH